MLQSWLIHMVKGQLCLLFIKLSKPDSKFVTVSPCNIMEKCWYCLFDLVFFPCFTSFALWACGIRGDCLFFFSTRPVEKVLSGALTPSTAQTWSKPWRSSTSLPRMPSPHRLPPHPGNELSGAHDVTAVFSLVKPESDRSCLSVVRCSASSPPRHLFLQGCSFKGKAGWVFTSLLEPSCSLYLSVCSILITLPRYIQHHCAFIRSSWFDLFTLNHWCLMYTIMFSAPGEVSASSCSPPCLSDL